jgi:hypothetical protein
MQRRLSFLEAPDMGEAMIKATVGRADLEYRYYVTIEIFALMTASQHDEYDAKGGYSPACDPEYESRYTNLDWVRVEKVCFARSRVDEVATEIGSRFRDVLLVTEDGTRYYYELRRVPFVAGELLCRSTVHVSHSATVPHTEYFTNHYCNPQEF